VPGKFDAGGGQANWRQAEAEAEASAKSFPGLQPREPLFFKYFFSEFDA